MLVEGCGGGKKEGRGGKRREEEGRGGKRREEGGGRVERVKIPDWLSALTSKPMLFLDGITEIPLFRNLFSELNFRTDSLSSSTGVTFSLESVMTEGWRGGERDRARGVGVMEGGGEK
jgi:hypothetical protein